MEKRKLLFLDDDREWLSTYEVMLGDNYDLYFADSPESARGTMQKVDIDMAILDLNLEGHSEDGLGIYKFITKNYPNTSIAFLSSDYNTQRVRDASRLPAENFVVKEGDFEDELRRTIESGLLTRNAKNIAGRDPGAFKTNAPSVKKLILEINRVVDNDKKNSTILIFGESGTGKEHLAKYIAFRSNKKLISTNMAGVSEDKAISELFGHMKGSFTGAFSDKVGLIQTAHNNIFFMDEIGECSLDVQAKLLRTIQEKEIVPLGSNVTKKIDVRFVAATHRDLGQMVEAGAFRLDLLQRISTFTFTMPALRDRKEDIPYYANMFLNEFPNEERVNILSSGYNALLNYSWPGNIRELKNVINRVVVASENRRFDEENVTAAIQAVNNKSEIKLTEKSTVENILDTLKEFGGNRSQAAQKLNMSVRSLQRWIKKNGFAEIVPSKSGRPQSTEGGL